MKPLDSFLCNFNKITKESKKNKLLLGKNKRSKGNTATSNKVFMIIFASDLTKS